MIVWRMRKPPAPQVVHAFQRAASMVSICSHKIRASEAPRAKFSDGDFCGSCERTIEALRRRMAVR